MGPYSQATRAGQFIFCAGQGGVDPTTGKLVEGGIREQTRQTIRNLQDRLAEDCYMVGPSGPVNDSG
jgi:2-iminobutanoate/2-iminopropanoate deaminase